MSEVHAGECFRCKHGALLYKAILKSTKQVVWICYECKQLVGRT